MAFDPDKYLKDLEEKPSAFDPDAYLAEEVKPVPVSEAVTPTVMPEEIGTLETLGRGALQGATMGFGEEIGAAIQTVPASILEKSRALKESMGMSKIQSELVDKLNKKYQLALAKGDTERADKVAKMIEKETGTPFKAEEAMSIGDIYDERVAAGRAIEKQAREESPYLYGAGELVGGIAPGLATGGAGAITAIGTQGLKQAAIQGAKAGAKYGAISGLGYSEAEKLPEMAKDVATGTVAGGVLGAVVPVAGSKIKKGFDKVVSQETRDYLYDKAPRMIKKIIKSTKIASEGEEVVGAKVETKELGKIQQLAEDTQTLLETSRVNANKLIEEALDPKVKIKVSDQYGKYVEDLNNALKNLAPDSDEAKQLKNAIQTINNQRQEILGSALADTSLPTKKQAYETLLQKLETIKFQNEIGVPQAKAIDNLFNKAAKMQNIKPDSLDAVKIQQDFNLASTDDAISMLKEVAKLNIKKLKVDPKTGEISEIPAQLREVIKKYEPRISEKGERLFLERGPGQVRESEIIKFRPDMIEAPLEVSPQQLRALEAQLREYSKKADPAGILTNISSDLRQTLLNSLPKELSEKFQKGMATQSDIKTVRDLINKNLTSKFESETTTGKQALANLLEEEHGFGGATEGSSRVVRDKIKEVLGRIDPKFSEKLQKESAKSAELLDLNRVGEQRGISPGIIASGIESGGVRIGEMAGKGINLAKKGISYVNDLASLSKAKLIETANSVSQTSPKLSKLLTHLANFETESKRKALLFVASQKPDLKSEIDAMFGNEEE